VDTDSEDQMELAIRVRAMWLQADRLAAAGVAVFPMDSDAPVPPDALAWATCDRHLVDAWWLGHHAGDGYGLLLGSKSAGLFGLHLTGDCRHWRFFRAGHRGTLRFDIRRHDDVYDFDQIVLFRRSQGMPVRSGTVVRAPGGSVTAITAGALPGPGITPNGDFIVRSGHAAPAYAPPRLVEWINTRVRGHQHQLHIQEDSQ